MKRCSKCKVAKPLREFHMRRKATGERHNDCRECRKVPQTPAQRAKAKAWREANADKRRAAQRLWNETHREHRREYQMVKNYGITPAQRDALLAEQGGRCAICGTDKPARRWATDHDHSCCPGQKTCGQCIRGILCESCNAGIGQFRDNPDVLRRAALYAEAAHQAAGSLASDEHRIRSRPRRASG